MTRAELLDILLKQKEAGIDMNLPVVLRVTRRIEDKRTATGFREQKMFASVTHMMHSTLSFTAAAGDAAMEYGRKSKLYPHSTPSYEVAELFGKALIDWSR